jgi:hypothetical protein
MTAYGDLAQLSNIRLKLKADGLKQDKDFFLNGIARPYIAKTTCKKLLRYGWKMVPNLIYSLDLTRTNYYLFSSGGNGLGSKKFDRNVYIVDNMVYFSDP